MSVQEQIKRVTAPDIRARKGGYFKEPARVEHLKKDADFDALRKRSDFLKLLAELTAKP